MTDLGLPCDECGGPTYMPCHVEGIPTTCMECATRRSDELAELDEQQHQEEMRQLEEKELEND
ncbi:MULTISPECIES: hypothetical protein [Halocynthiibacter]|uniref:Uncharacterized protein n=1 Tax=Halocynthiibacter halioticoli TaxID=2986804 RepID=A0AAE3LSN7_9RHOB|nr:MULTISPECIES: hypothetical protein [Halocynthiibacter]MCV6826033.1 hypothetical protein [Halocynthiibacter halioticoli]MCW4059034.1 hypothetical protein [Halocynthiibacter sp. SDUM655004]